MKLKNGIRYAVTIALCAPLFATTVTHAKPRPPQPPWPQASLMIFGFDSAYARVPWDGVALNEELALTVESWSGYALVRDNLPMTPVVIPPLSPSGRKCFAAEIGAVRCWIAPNWSSAGGMTGGNGPGHFARLLELVDFSGKEPQVRCSLYLNETGDTIYLSGQTKNGASDLLQAKVSFAAGDWRLVTLCYSATNTALWLDDELVALGEGLLPPPAWSETSLGVVVGSDALGLDGADAQFDELTTFAHWPRPTKWQEMYFQAVKRTTLLGPLGTKAEELAKDLLLKAAGWPSAADGADGNDPIALCSYGSNCLWLQITGVTNGQASVILWGTQPDIAYEILSREILTNIPWAGEQMILGAPEQDWTPFLVPVGTRTNQLFLWARSYIDTDGDGLPDWWEMENGLNPNNPDTGNTGVSDGYKDGDGDGWTNLQEYQNGTKPNVFNTPAAPTGLVVTLSAGGAQGSLRWNRAAGGVTGYTIERTFSGVTTTLSGNPDSYVDTQATVPTAVFFTEPSYRISAEYAPNGSSGWTPWVFAEESRTAALRLQPGTGGDVVGISMPVPATAGFLRVGLWTPGNPHQSITNVDLPVSGFVNGAVTLSAAAVNILTNDGFRYARWISTNNIPSAAMFPYYDAPFGFRDGRAQLKENLIFLLREASSAETFHYYWDNPPPHSSYSIYTPTNYAYAGIHDLVYAERLAFLNEHVPFQENYRNRNFVLGTGDLSDWGWLNTGAGWGVYGPALWSPSKYEYVPSEAIVSIPPLLGSNRWIYAIGHFPGFDFDVGGFEQSTDYMAITGPVGGQVLSLLPAKRNLFGLEYQSVKTTWGSNATETVTLTLGAPLSMDDNFFYASFFPEVAWPQFQTASYYFARPAMDWMPGQTDGAPTNLTQPSLICGLGQAIELASYAQLRIANGYTNMLVYLGQYFDKALRITNGVVTTNQTGILSPYGEFFPTEPGPNALVTLPDLDTNERGTGIVHVVKLQLDVNHDSVMELPFNSPDNTSPDRPFVFWVNNDYDRAIRWGDGHVDPDEDVMSNTPGLVVYERVPDSEYSFTGYGVTPIRRIPSLRDLEDFARLWICGVTTNLLPSLPVGTVVTLSWGDKGNPNANNPTIDLFKAADTNGNYAPYGSYGYLTNDVSAILQTNSLLYVAKLEPGDSIEGSATNFLGLQRLIWCGVKKGAGKLTLTFSQGGTNTIAETSAYIEVKDIKEMYERWTVSDVPSISPAPTNRPYLATDGLPVGAPPFQYAAPGNTNSSYILLVHDYDLPTWKKDRYAETAFKRFYWQGYQGRFGLFRWPGVSTGFRPLDDSEFNAWRSGTGLLNLLTNLNVQYPDNVYLMAHGFGAVAAGEALRLAGTNELVNTYIAMQGAVASHAYDPSAPLRRPPPFTTPDFYSFYHTNNAPYFWPFGGAGAYINYYNTNDVVLTNQWRDTQETKPDFGYHWNGTNFSKGFISPYSLLLFPVDRYEIFSYCDEARCEAIGAQPNLGGPFNPVFQLNLSTLPFPVRGIGSDHSGQFKSFSADTWSFWRAALISLGLKQQQ